MNLVLDIPGRRRLELNHLVLDLNGTLAVDGRPEKGVAEALAKLQANLTCHLVTADTFGTAGGLFPDLVRLAVIEPGREAEQKLALVKSLGAEKVAAVGNGANDVLMLGAAALGICVLGWEGADPAALAAADVAVPGPVAALELLLRTDRLRATLRR